MTIQETLSPQMMHEFSNTRKTLERVPLDQFDWKPHPKSGSMGWLANHLVNLPLWATMTLERDSLEITAPDNAPPTDARTTSDLLSAFDRNVDAVQTALSNASDEHLRAPWILYKSGVEIINMPRIAVLRGMILSHMIHHRGQMTVYLRLNDIPVPALYGPSADEGNF